MVPGDKKTRSDGSEVSNKQRVRSEEAEGRRRIQAPDQATADKGKDSIGNASAQAQASDDITMNSVEQGESVGTPAKATRSDSAEVEIKGKARATGRNPKVPATPSGSPARHSFSSMTSSRNAGQRMSNSSSRGTATSKQSTGSGSSGKKKSKNSTKFRGVAIHRNAADATESFT